jgi:ankyrin repeat protein
VQNNDGETPLDWAIKRKDIATTDLLRKHGAKTNDEM